MGVVTSRPVHNVQDALDLDDIRPEVVFNNDQTKAWIHEFMVDIGLYNQTMPTGTDSHTGPAHYTQVRRIRAPYLLQSRSMKYNCRRSGLRLVTAPNGCTPCIYVTKAVNCFSRRSDPTGSLSL